MQRRTLLQAALAASLAAEAATAADAPKLLRYAFQVAETGFDPAQLTDLYSQTITAHIFEAPYGYDPLAVPPRIVPLTAEALPEVSADFRTFRLKLKPGILFADDPAFGGKPRELVATDYVYSWKRMADPAVKSPNWAAVEELGIVGLRELRTESQQLKQPFNYDRPIEGLRAVDRYTLEIRLAQPRPRLVQALAQSDRMGALAREVVEAQGADLMAHPVGTGPFRLARWRRSSLIVLERNPTYRERFYESQPAADDKEGLAIAARLNGRRIPMVDRVEISIIEESQPRWLSFLNGEQDLVDRVPPEFVHIALPHGKVAPNLARRGIQLTRTLAADTVFTFFNLQDPVVGGYAPEKVALRRAISLSWDVEREIRLQRRGQAIPAQSLLMPHTSGYDPHFKSEIADHDVARANALLDTYGYLDRDGDGWRELPDGRPLVIEFATEPDSLRRSYDELWKRSFASLRLQVRFNVAKWPENLKAARAGKIAMWFLSDTSTQADGAYGIQRLYSRQIGARNMSRFQLPEFDRIYEQLQVLPDGPEREALFLQVKRLQAAYMPLKSHVHRIIPDLQQPWIYGYRRPLFRYEFWHFLDVLPH
ncbi:ABC transporter substrate-binding protein [Pelomonas sp. SE-A7]|uniref:ABC transporter substrate-binding protein n=1 Tax=Pelomonas sp. SE-A7 TaxID=3054953 RepID=UPI00259CA1C9|nr:ABC transporter substrate-binding protein [Pelomonas sp. SE-A7]MDM4767160.1 ABC transporter substrate-binding protein [Pelomonas sp. SE-A7]